MCADLSAQALIAAAKKSAVDEMQQKQEDEQQRERARAASITTEASAVSSPEDEQRLKEQVLIGLSCAQLMEPAMWIAGKANSSCSIEGSYGVY